MVTGVCVWGGRTEVGVRRTHMSEVVVVGGGGGG